jgi:hypothetical protein
MDYTSIYNSVLSAIPFDDLGVEAKVFAMARVGAEMNEIAIETGIDAQTLQTEYAEILLKGYSKGHFEIRSAQHNEAIYKGNQTMLKHLGAHRLKQIDELIVKTSPLDQPVVDLKSLSKAELISLLEKQLQALKKQ